MIKPIVWTIAGIDPAGLSGTQVDLETLRNLNVAAYSIITAVTAQNTNSVTAIEAISAEHVATQCETLFHSFKPNAIKMGMLGTLSVHKKIAAFLKTYAGYVVLDPVLASSSGSELIFSNLQQHIESLETLFPFIDVITPNVMEAEKILNVSLRSYQDIENGAHAILDLGVKSVLLKGGHVGDKLFSQDYWTNGADSFWIATQRSPEKNYRGTGCTLSSAVAAFLALGYTIKDAIVIAKMYINRGIRLAHNIDQKTAKLFHGGWPEEQVDLPYVSSEPLLQAPKPFKRCYLGLYPVVNSSLWLEQLLPQGVSCIQLRMKNTSQAILEKEIQRCVVLAKQYGARLFINDYWELAIRYGADGIHLGQEDLYGTDIEQIHRSGLYLGVSTHCYYEVARAHAIHPSYIACGPIYSTTSKEMLFQPQGIDQLKRWRRTLDYPLVAIGGINLERLAGILQSSVDGVALISAITEASDPLEVTQQFLAKIREYADAEFR